ncbi:IS5 family transposase [Acetobacter senegalensis]|uniref:IS5 family transposase n=1 Tax=Acetobacter senegalensis TaxID=446692 RepID=UPI00128D7B6D|nr:IS5 family transposase [Acetobacter senegalensis]MCG4258487.1 IS5 family transposase [Acetobacter senegalensis]MCG4268367.1 IS5 family transposase [Acetobacter senegalensis]MPQ72895.1 IS5 family transposase [Acetobacter senegalensis]
MKQPGFFDVEERLARLSGLGDQLEAFSRTVDFEVFRPDLDQAPAYSDGIKGGRPPFDAVLMFKILVIQTLNNLSDERTEYLINDRLSFMRFLGLRLSDRVPDAKTVWLFREHLTQAGAIDGLFNRFDATLVAASKQRNTNAEKADLQAGRIPQDWQDKPAKLFHKDRHARWTLKFIKAKRQDDGTTPSTDLAIPFFGYKSHGSIDRKFRLIRKWKATDAAASDGARLREGLLDRINTASDIWADTAYRSKANEAFMEKHGFVSRVHRKKPHFKPMPCHIQRSNAGKSVIRSRVEHVFADQKSQMGLFIRTIGITRATMKIGLANIVYNMRRFIFLERISATA